MNVLIFECFISSYSCARGGKVALHEIVVRRFTNIFDKIKSSKVEDLKDGDGNFVFILEGVDLLTLRGLSELLYTGAATLLTEAHKKELFELLSSEVVDSTHCSEETITVAEANVSFSDLHEDTKFVASSQVKHPKTEAVIGYVSYEDPLSWTGPKPSKISKREQQKDKLQLPALPDGTIMELPDHLELLKQKIMNRFGLFDSAGNPSCLTTVKFKDSWCDEMKLKHKGKLSALSCKTPDIKWWFEYLGADSMGDGYYRCWLCATNFDRLNIYQKYEKVKPAMADSVKIKNNVDQNRAYLKKHSEMGIHKEIISRVLAEHKQKLQLLKEALDSMDVLQPWWVDGTEGVQVPSEKPFACTICGARFAYASGLKRHMVSHDRTINATSSTLPRKKNQSDKGTYSGLKPYACDICGECFALTSTLERHERLHEESRIKQEDLMSS